MFTSDNSTSTVAFVYHFYLISTTINYQLLFHVTKYVVEFSIALCHVTISHRSTLV